MNGEEAFVNVKIFPLNSSHIFCLLVFYNKDSAFHSSPDEIIDIVGFYNSLEKLWFHYYGMTQIALLAFDKVNNL